MTARVGLAMAAAALLAAGAAAAAAPPVQAHVQGAWIRWLPANLPAAGYATLVNDGDAPLELTGASSPAYGMVMLHRSRLAEGDSTMEKVARLAVPAHARVELAPGGYHLMLMHATRAIQPGDTVPMTLHFAGGAELQADFSVLPANASGPAGD